MIVALDRQHVGKPHRIDDLGAWGDLDGDGEHSDVIESEAIWTGIISLHAEMELRRLGHSVYPMSHGRYSQRHQDANQARVDVYVALHLNSLTGGTRSGQSGNYGAVFYDHRSGQDNGPALADAIAAELGKLPALRSKLRIWPARPDNWTRRAFSTIQGVQAPAICYEPAFLDYERHQQAFFQSAESVAVLGQALAAGIHAWGQSREVTRGTV